ncbi:superfamily I DNA helicase, partial [Reticulomyxa filosa]
MSNNNKKKRIANNEKTNEKQILTSNILQLLLKNKKNRVFWIELLADSSMISNHSVFSKALQSSLIKWLRNKEEERDASQDVPFHSKVIELVSSDTFAKARLYHPRLKESVNERHDELSMNNKKWTLEEIGICATVNWELWPQIFNNINNIPKIGDLDEKKEEPVSDKLCSNLSYCFECRLWFERENSMQMELSTFFSKVLTQLVTNDSLLSINIHKYLMQHQNEIKDISSHCSMDLKSSLQKLEEIVNEYQQFFELLRIFKSIHSDYLLEHDLPDRVKEFEQQSDSWEAQVFVNVKDNYKDEIQLLQSCEEKMKIILERSQSLMFQKMWKKCNTQCKSIMNQKPFSIFNKTFDNMNHTWECFKQVCNHFFFFFIYLLEKKKKKKRKLSLFNLFCVSSGWMCRAFKMDHSNEMKHLFPEYKDEQRQEIANDVEQKFKKEIDLKEQLQSWIELRKVTEKIKEYHPCKDKIREDEKWKEYVKALARMEEITRTNEDISIEQTSQCEGAKPCVDIGLFDVLNRCEDQLKILVQNQNFNDEAHFENTLNVLSKSKHQAIQDLVTSLRHVNSIMQETLWKCPLEDTTSLAKAILKLHSNDQEFVKMISKCCDMDLNNISIM